MRTKCRSIATFHRPIHSHWSLPLSTEKISASTNSVEISVARYQAQEKYLLRQIAWKFLLRVIKPRKILALTNSVEILVARYQAQKKLQSTK